MKTPRALAARSLPLEELRRPQDADALAVITEWQEFREPDFARMKKLMRTPVVFDGRNIYQRDAMTAHGFTYFSIGR